MLIFKGVIRKLTTQKNICTCIIHTVTDNVGAFFTVIPCFTVKKEFSNMCLPNT